MAVTRQWGVKRKCSFLFREVTRSEASSLSSFQRAEHETELSAHSVHSSVDDWTDNAGQDQGQRRQQVGDVVMLAH